MLILEEPCDIPEHKNQGYTLPVFDLDKNGNPISKPGNGNRVLFYGCVGCDDDKYNELMPACPEDHRELRYFSPNWVGCRACNRYVAISEKFNRLQPA